MLVWLTSFPRSGNSLLRTIFNHCFGLETYSKYERTNEYSNVDIAKFMGARPFGGELDDFLEKARAEQHVTVVKTHEEPESDDRAIYIIRNGLIATDSYRHYLAKIENVQCTWQQVVDGTAFPTWSAHIEAWSPMDRPNTLPIRYEDLLSPAAQENIDRIADFTGLPMLRKWVNPFDTLQGMGKNYFRRGKVSVPWSIKKSEIDYFMSRNRLWMDRFGYSARRSIFTLFR